MQNDYSKHRKGLDTGDILLFSGRGPISAIIQLGTLCKWSHVGMVLKLPEYDFLCSWESTSLTKEKDLRSGTIGFHGVQLTQLSTTIENYNGEIGVRLLQVPQLHGDELARLMELRKELQGRPYEASKLELFRAAYDGPFGRNEEDLSTVFCSELVAEAYQRMGLIGEDKPSNEWTPKDWAHWNDNNMLMGKPMLSDIHMLKWDENKEPAFPEGNFNG